MAIQWSEWAALGKPTQGPLNRPYVHRQLDGRLAVFALGMGRLFTLEQVVPNGRWQAHWLAHDKPLTNLRIQTLVVGHNQDGRLEVFMVGEDGGLWQKWQLALSGDWSEWNSLGSPALGNLLTDHFTAGRNQDGRQEVFALSRDGNIWQIWQTAPNGGWSAWGKLGRPTPGIRPGDRLSVAANRDGRLAVFVMGSDEALWHTSQLFPNAGWSPWESLGKPRDAFPQPQARDLFDPLVQVNADGHLEVFALGNGAFCNRWQEAADSLVWRQQGWNAKARPPVGLSWLEVALNPSQRLEVISLGEDGALWHAWQVDQFPHWSDWHSLGHPPMGLRASDGLHIGTNQDGRLEVFVAGQDGSLWHRWQLP